MCMEEVKCVACQDKLGIVSPQLPDKRLLTVFGGKRVRFLDPTGEEVEMSACCKGRAILWDKAARHEALQAVPRLPDYNGSAVPLPAHMRAPRPPLVAPSCTGCPLSTSQCLDWHDCIDEASGFKPRALQVEAFRRCVLYNHIVVLPTGFGKTLIASMVMARMVKLNPAPGRLALLIVDRIPLVDQQKRAIENQTGLTVASLWSGSDTSFNKRNLFSGAVQALVATAGKLLHLLTHYDIYGIRMSCFSVAVFDECHHATGRHSYARLLKLIKDEDLACRPRLVGLTASPCRARTVQAAAKGLSALMAEFGEDTLLYRPELEKMRRANDETVTVPDTPLQLEAGNELWSDIERLSYKLGLTSKTEDQGFASSLDELMDANSLGKIKGLARDLQGSDPDSQAATDDLLRLLCAWENNTVLGPYAAQWYMPGASSSSARAGQHDGVPDEQLSAQLMELEHIIRDAGEGVRCLVFVEMKDTAELLTQRLKATFPSLNPSRVVGQQCGGRGSGMTIQAQRAVIRDFHSGACRLIVCTSVLEEGFDVPECNLVFRIHGRASLIQQVQSRGRARAENGKLVTICSSGYIDRAKQLQDEERFLEEALGHQREKSRQALVRVGYFSAADGEQEGDGALAEELLPIEEVLGRFAPDDDDDGVAEDESRSGGRRYALSSVAVKMYLLVEQGRMDGVRGSIVQAIKETGIDLSGDLSDSLRIEILPGRGANQDLGAGACALHTLASVAILSLPTGTRHFFKMFASVWDFRVRGATDVSIVLPTAGSCLAGQETETEWRRGTLLSVLDISKVTVGYMPEHGTFVPCNTLSDAQTSGGASCFAYTSMDIERGERWMLRATSSSGEEVQVEAATCTLGSCVYISAVKTQGDKSVVLYLPLRSAPAVRYRLDSNQNWRRAASQLEQPRPGDALACSPLEAAQATAESQLRMLASQPMIAVEFAWEAWDHLAAALRDPRNLGVPALVTRVHDNLTTSNAEAREYSRGESLLLQGDAALSEGLSPDYAPAVTDALLGFACLETHVYCPPLHPRCLSVIFRDVKEAIRGYLGSKGDSGDHRRLAASVRAMQHILALVDEVHVFDDVAKLYTAHVDMVMKDPREVIATDGSDRDRGYYDIARVMATPSRLVCKPPITMKSNRLMRLFAHSHRLVYITFREEDGQYIYTPSVFRERFSRMVEPAGIPGGHLQGLPLRLLVASGSQLREQTAVFVVTEREGDVDDMRRRIIPNPEEFAGKVFKYISRLGLFCTADFPALELPEWSEAEDARSADGTKALTDGSGLIDSGLLSAISSRLPDLVPHGCCALQIRHSGNKGVLVRKPRGRGAGSDAAVVMRESMVKFRAEDHRMLCVVKAAAFHKLRLNRDGLNILFSLGGEGEAGGDWELLPVMLAMQEAELSSLAAALTDHSSATRKLIECSAADRTNLLALSKHGATVLNEPHFRRLLQQIYDYDVRHLRSKTHILVPKAALLMGIPDPVQVLNDGQVFVQVHRPGEEEAEVITGPVLIYRNPLLHPGDVRVLEAVPLKECPNLLPWSNVVVFPASDGRTERCIPAECSGGDLDGDMFSVIWDPALVPPLHRIVPAFDYEAFAKERQMTDLPKADLTVADSVMLAMTNACLGRIARTHLALCDIQERGALDPLAVEVAKQQSLAVDYPKTGIAPTIPKAAKDLVKDNGYPDFMEHKRGVGYLSSKPLGKLYQQCRAISCEMMLEGLGGSTSQPPTLDMRYVRDGHRSHLDGAQAAFREYQGLVQRALIRFGLRTEEELILALPSELPEELDSNRDHAYRAMRDAWRNIRERMRTLFFSASQGVCSPSDEEDRASAWYVAAYGPRKREPAAGESGIPSPGSSWGDCFYLGFPWVLSDILVRVLSSADVPAALPAPDQLLAGADAMAYWMDQREVLTTVLHSREAAFRTVEGAILEHLTAGSPGAPRGQVAPANVVMFGSVSQFLCAAGSDIDVYIDAAPSEARHLLPADTGCWLEAYVSPAVEGISKRTKFMPGDQSGVPVVKILMDNCGEDVNVDICAIPDGMHKSMLLRKLFRLHPCYLPFFACVTGWARACALIRLADDATTSAGAPLKSGELHAIILHTLQRLRRGSGQTHVPCAGAVEGVSVSSRAEEDRADFGFEYLAHSDSCDAGVLGRLLLAFFHTGARLADGVDSPEDLTYTWPVPGAPVHRIAGALLPEVARRCAHAYHCLARSGSWETVLAQAVHLNDAPQEFHFKLPPGVAHAISHLVEFHAERLRLRTQAEVWFELGPGSDVTVRGRGTPRQLQLLRAQIMRLMRTGRLVGVVRRNNRPFFMEGCTFLSAQGATASTARLSIHRYPYDGINDDHSLVVVGGAALWSAPQGRHVWAEQFVSDLSTKVFEQLDKLAAEERADDLIDSLRASVHCGHYYLMHAFRCFEGATSNVALSTVMEALEALSSRRTFARPDFDDLLFRKYDDAAMEEFKPGGSGSTAEGGAADGGEAGGAAPSGSGSDSEGAQKAARPLNSGFHNCISPWSLDPTADLKQLYAACESWARSVLLPLGYTEEPGNAGGAPSQGRPSHAWHVSVVGSHSYHVDVKLDERLQLLQVTERPVRWIHGTLIASTPDHFDGAAPSKWKPPDLRVKLTTQTTLEPDSKLYQKSCPEGESPILVDPETRQPTPALSKEDEHRVHFASHTLRRKAFKLRLPAVQGMRRRAVCPSFDVNLRAELTLAMHYNGEKLSLPTPMASLSFEVDIAPLKQYLRQRQECRTPAAGPAPNKGPATREAVDEWQRAYMHHLLDVAERMAAEPADLETYTSQGMQGT